MQKIFVLPCLILWILLSAACAAPPSVAQQPVTVAQAPKPPPRMSDPLPPQRLGDAPQLDYSCKTNTDCAVKNVGNCCGAMPACVNKDSPVDPAAVRARCAKNGMMSVCGFREISACTCNEGRCEEAVGSGQVSPRKLAQPIEPAR